MRLRRTTAFLAACVLLPVAAADAAPPPVPPSGPGVHLHDPRLRQEIERAQQRAGRAEGRSVTATVVAEVLTTDTDTVARHARAIGAEVQGVVDGALVQVRVPVDAVDEIASLDVVTDMQYPRLAGRPPAPVDALPRPDATDTGVVSAQVQRTNAAAWHAAGLTGSGVKVGIIDYFDLDLWDTVEHGPVPDGAHQFCRDSLGQGLCALDGTIRRGLSTGSDAFVHGVAVAEIIHDMAPDAEIFIASVATTADLQAAINWFAARGVRIVNRSLGSAYDGPGDGTGPLASVVNAAAAKRIVWFNSAGNDGESSYLMRSVRTTHAADGGQYVDFDGGRVGASPDTWLRVRSEACFFMDGVRWSNDWTLPAGQRTDYSVEFWEPRSSTSGGEHSNPSLGTVQPIDLSDQGGSGVGANIINRSQRSGATPLEAPDIAVCPTRLQLDGTYTTFIRVRRNADTPVGATPDRLELGIAGNALLEADLWDRRGSAAKPVVDSRNPSLISVGAVDLNASMRLDPANTSSIAWYSSQGPTTDGRVKPDISSIAGMGSVTYGSSFSGTSAASPTAAGAAALMLGAGLASPGAPLAALVRHLTVDRGPGGLDNAYGAGVTWLPNPPATAPAGTPGRYVAAARTVRILDTRRATHVGPANLVGPFRPYRIVDLAVTGVNGVPATGVTAVALNITSVGSRTAGYVQALPTLRAAVGATSTANITVAGTTTANFAIVPVGAGGRVSVYMPVGGDLVLDLAGWFTTAGVDAGTGAATAGRLVPLAVPEHWRTVTATAGTAPVLSRPTGSAVPAGASVAALVVAVSASKATANGYVRLFPTGARAASYSHSNVNFVRGRPATNLAIVPVGTNGRVSMFVYGNPRDSVVLDVDVVGWITSAAAASSPEGTFVPLAPFRLLDSRTTSAFAAAELRTLVANRGGVPANAAAISANATVTGTTAAGLLQVRPGGRPAQIVRTVTFSSGQTVAAGTITGLTRGPSSATVNVFLSRAGHAIIDVTGYFTGPAAIT